MLRGRDVLASRVEQLHKMHKALLKEKGASVSATRFTNPVFDTETGNVTFLEGTDGDLGNYE